MGDDPTRSVVGPEGRLWDVENVLVVDSSVFPTSAGYNPTLTIMALAGRATRLLLGEPLAPTVAHRRGAPGSPDRGARVRSSGPAGPGR